MSIFKERYKGFKEKVNTNRVYKLSFLSLVIQIGSGISVFIFMLLSLTLFQLGGKLTIDPVLLSRVNTSEKVVLTDVFSDDMPNINTKVTRIMLQYFIETTFTMNFEKAEVQRKFFSNAEVYFLSTYAIWAKIRDFMQPLIDSIAVEGNEKTAAVDIIDIRNLTSNLWQSYFDMRIYDPVTEKLTVQRYVLNVRVGYYPERVVMTSTFSNPLGFAVTEFNIAKARSN